MSLVAIVGRDLIISTRITNAAEAAGHDVIRVDDPSRLPVSDTVAVVFVDWGQRDAAWSQLLSAWCQDADTGHASPRIVLFGPHTDLEAHAAARAAGFGPMLARSKMISDLPRLLGSLAPV